MLTGLLGDVVLTLSVLTSTATILAAARVFWHVGRELTRLASRSASLQQKIGDAALLLR